MFPGRNKIKQKSPDRSRGSWFRSSAEGYSAAAGINGAFTSTRLQAARAMRNGQTVMTVMHFKEPFWGRVAQLGISVRAIMICGDTSFSGTGPAGSISMDACSLPRPSPRWFRMVASAGQSGLATGFPTASCKVPPAETIPGDAGSRCPDEASCSFPASGGSDSG